MWCNTLGRAITANEKHVFSVIGFLNKNKEYLGVSGDGDFFEIFDVSILDENELLSNHNLCLFTFFINACFFLLNF